ncbi:MAG: polysaccharide deacetylase family protein [Akkermansiaceae bacterium]|nr:polysaccharide deacetylase family protein [Armatimonadota bacterium]
MLLVPPVPALIASPSTPVYADSLALAISRMETERHKDALKPLKAALTLDRNDPLGVLTLATLYLHSGSSERAAKEFARVRQLAPNEPLAVFGAALADLSAGRKAQAGTTLAGIRASAVPSAPLLADYVRLMSGDASRLSGEYANIAPEEPDLLRLEIAAFIALRAKNMPRAEMLLSALLKRPQMKRLQEDTALVLPFDSVILAQGCAGTLPTALGFPEPIQNERPLSGHVSFSPPAGISTQAIGYVAFTVDGGHFSASTNYPPFAADWNTLRVPNGDYTLRTQVFDRGQQLIKETARTVTVRNAGSTATSNRLSDPERAEMRRRLLVLLTPRPSRKAAHFALAERAVAKGDSATALSHIESVVAIDPDFRDARASLRTFNRQVAGPCEGIWKGQTTERIVALTFDDGPKPEANRTPALLNALKKENALATFFVVGKMVEKSPELVTRMFDEGHEIANHSFSHPNLTYLSASAVERELCRTSVAVRDLTGVRPRFYRPPGGNFNTQTVDAARALGLAGAYWTLDAIRLETAPLPPAQLTKYVLQNVRPGSIVLLHNAPENTVAAVPDIVRGLRERGYKIVTLSELVKRSKPIVKTAITPRSARMFDGGE